MRIQPKDSNGLALIIMYLVPLIIVMGIYLLVGK